MKKITCVLAILTTFSAFASIEWEGKAIMFEDNRIQIEGESAKKLFNVLETEEVELGRGLKRKEIKNTECIEHKDQYLCLLRPDLKDK